MSQATRVFRVFVSSTFVDFKPERNALQALVFPRLRAHSAERGYEFQAIDLRWGVGQEASLDQRAMGICLDELARCQTMSPRPNFIVLLGDRYGWRPLPESIPEDEYSAIAFELGDPGAVDLLEEWYELDENAAPPEFRLRKRGGRFADDAVWYAEVEAPLRSALEAAAGALELVERRRSRYDASATEQEILAGALAVPDAGEHVFCFSRTIEKVDELPDSDALAGFVDLDEEGHLDAAAHDRVTELRERLEGALTDNFFEYPVVWTDDGIGEDHIPGLCDDVYRCLELVIDAEITRLTRTPRARQETEAHEAFCRERAEVFVGRVGMLATIADYMAGDDSHPLGIFGEGGLGKSALMAKAATSARDGHPEARVVTRFIGTTPDSSDGRALLEFLCRELAALAEDREPVPSTYEDLVAKLPEYLENAAAGGRLVVLLDALDQLSAAANARSLIWLPRDLPEGVRLVVTTRPGEPLVALRNRLPEGAVVELGRMSKEEGAEMLDALLAKASRRLTRDQRDRVLRGFAQEGSPLYLKLAFEEARLWTSTTEAPEPAADVRAIIDALYDRVAGEHGAVLVERALAYMAAGRDGSGLAESELLDVLSADEDVLEEFEARGKHTPPERRLPTVIWARLYADIEPYLTTRTSENTVLQSFFHRELAEVAVERFLAPAAVARNTLLADVFRRAADPAGDGTWEGTARALAELPYHLIQAELWDDVFAVLTDFSFLEKKAVKVGVVESHDAEGAVTTAYTGALALLSDYDLALAGFPED